MKPLVYAPETCLGHDPGPHPECPQRLEVLRRWLATAKGIDARAARDATEDDLLLVHDRKHVARVRAASSNGLTQLDPDTLVQRGSFEAALAAAGAALTACDAIMAGDARRAFCAVRPPGHHALRDRTMGFCLFNNVAIAARHLQRRHGVERVLIVDFDVHHGNGTEAIFADDESVFFWSLHRWPFWPGSGGPEAHGSPRSRATINTPLSADTTPEEYLSIFRATLAGIGRIFAPGFVLVSAGFDAFVDDPIGGLNLLPRDFRAITEEIVSFADQRCDGRVVSLLEGGYALDGLVHCVAEHVSALS